MGMTAQLKILSSAELATLTVAPDQVEDLLFPEDVENPFEGQFDLEKAWHSIHYVLTGQAQPDGTPLGDAVLGGQEIGPNLGYGRARLIPAGRVQEIHEALSKVDFNSRFASVDKSPNRLSEIYLGSCLRSELDYLTQYFNALVAAYATAAGSKSAVLAYLA
jgi:hypothetical protein